MRWVNFRTNNQLITLDLCGIWWRLFNFFHSFWLFCLNCCWVNPTDNDLHELKMMRKLGVPHQAISDNWRNFLMNRSSCQSAGGYQSSVAHSLYNIPWRWNIDIYHQYHTFRSAASNDIVFMMSAKCLQNDCAIEWMVWSRQYSSVNSICWSSIKIDVTFLDSPDCVSTYWESVTDRTENCVANKRERCSLSIA